MMDILNNANTFTASYGEDDDSANVILVDRFSNSISESDLSEKLDNISSNVFFIFTPEPLANFSINATAKSEVEYRDPLAIIVPISICYLIIFITGILGNVITCFVIAKNKTMHTATNYYLFNLAVSDFLVLILGMPFDFMNIWLPNSYPFDEIVCIIQGLLSETSANATILTITSFTCERYIAICHPFRSHKMSKLSRVVKFILAIWILAFALATPQALQFGNAYNNYGVSCTVVHPFFEHAFEISSFLFFIVPMTVLCVLYILIGVKLRQSKLLYGKKVKSSDSQRCISGQSRVIRMLIAVVVAFFLCWAPFHCQRIMAVYGKIMKKSSSNDDLFMRIYVCLTYTSGISYFLSTCINPFLYNIMSHKFRNASKLTLVVHCLSRTPSTITSQLASNYSALTLKFGALEGTRASKRNHSVLPSHNQNEIFQVKDVVSMEEARNFPIDMSPFSTDHSYQSVAKHSSFEPVSFSFSQTTTTTTATLSRDNSMKCINPKKVRINPNGVANVKQQEDIRKISLAEKLKKCTQRVLTFKSDANSTMGNEQGKSKLKKRISNESLKSHSSLKGIDEEASSEVAQMMNDINKGARHVPKEIS